MTSLNDHIVEHIGKEFPGFHVSIKTDVWHQQLIGWLLFWMWRFPKVDGKRTFERTFMTRFTTTLGVGIFITAPEMLRRPSFWMVLAHEFVHLWDARRLTAIPYDIIYLLPQLMAPLALLAFWNIWFLLFLVFLLPFPSFGRSWVEKRGYTMTMACNFWENGRISEVTKLRIVDNFTGSNYYWMMPFRGFVIRQVESQAAKIISGEILNDDAFKSIHDAYLAYKEENQ